MTRFFILLCLIACTSLGEQQEVEVNMEQSTLTEPSQNKLIDVFSVCYLLFRKVLTIASLNTSSLLPSASSNSWKHSRGILEDGFTAIIESTRLSRGSGDTDS